ncbi:MAG: ABC transporter permease [Nocardioidaceae bacterium]
MTDHLQEHEHGFVDPPDEGDRQPRRPTNLLMDAWRELRRSPMFLASAAVVVIAIALAIAPGAFAGWFGHGDPHVCHLSHSGGGPMAGHPFGFDMQGCDLYANVIYGARATVTIGLLVTASSLIVGVVMGAISGYLGGVVDVLISRLADVFFGFPFILGALIVLTVVSQRNVLTVSTVLLVFGWPTMTRLMRSTVLAQRGSDYVLAARSLGAGNFRLVRKHILPNAIGPVIIYSTLAIGGVMVAGASLTFLGVGLQSPAISWGLQLSDAKNYLQLHPHLLIFPGIFLSATVLGFIALGDVLRDALDPKLR